MPQEDGFRKVSSALEKPKVSKICWHLPQWLLESWPQHWESDWLGTSSRQRSPKALQTGTLEHTQHRCASRAALWESWRLQHYEKIPAHRCMHAYQHWGPAWVFFKAIFYGPFQSQAISLLLAVTGTTSKPPPSLTLKYPTWQLSGDQEEERGLGQPSVSRCLLHTMTPPLDQSEVELTAMQEPRERVLAFKWKHGLRFSNTSSRDLVNSLLFSGC